jgi:NAD(P)-dependent dehydrogenase (short-subunit alcohol dehydrogenase family)
LATAQLALAQGIRVVGLGRQREALDEVGAMFTELFTPAVCDVTDPDQVEEVLDTVCATVGTPDLVVNAAGISEPLSLLECTPSSWDRTIEVNLSGTYFVSRSSALRMSETGHGSIVNVGSNLSSDGAADFVSYCASKAGVVGMTKALAIELAPEVRVNVVCPGPVDTPMLANEFALSQDAELAEREMIEQVPLKRLAKPAEIAELILFVGLSGGFMTGSVVEIDGGVTSE